MFLEIASEDFTIDKYRDYLNNFHRTKIQKILSKQENG